MKKLLLPLICLIVGVAAGYYWAKSKCDASSGDKNPPPSTHNDKMPNHIDTALAKKLIQEYQKENNASPYQLQTYEGKPLKGYFIDRAALDTILKDKSQSGISIYLATDNRVPPGQSRARKYTLIYMGGRYTRDSSRIINGPVKTNSVKSKGGDDDNFSFDFSRPCPNACGNFN